LFQQYNDPAQLPTRRVVYPPRMARQHYAILRQKPTSDRHLAYALVLIFLFQTLLLSCVALFLGALVLFSFIGVISRAQEVEQLSVALTRVAPVTGNPSMSDAVPATLPAPTSTVTMTELPANPLPPTVAPTTAVATPPPAVTPLPGVASPLATPIDPAHPVPAGNPSAQPIAPAEIQAYANQVLPQIDQLSGALNLLQGLAQNPNLNDQQWVTNVSTQIAIIRNAHNNLQIVQPPQPVAALHNEFINAITACRTAVDTFNTAITTHNADNLNMAVTATQSCLASFPQASGRLRDYIASASGQ
jgi:hypothetical protein